MMTTDSGRDPAFAASPSSPCGSRPDGLQSGVGRGIGGGDELANGEQTQAQSTARVSSTHQEPVSDLWYSASPARLPEATQKVGAFTPGPWDVSKGATAREIAALYGTSDGHNNIVAQYIPSNAEQDANALLIAAAPTMHYALVEAKNLLRHDEYVTAEYRELVKVIIGNALALAAGTQSAETNEDLAQSEGCQSGGEAVTPTSYPGGHTREEWEIIAKASFDRASHLPED